MRFISIIWNNGARDGRCGLASPNRSFQGEDEEYGPRVEDL